MITGGGSAAEGADGAAGEDSRGNAHAGDHARGPLLSDDGGRPVSQGDDDEPRRGRGDRVVNDAGGNNRASPTWGG